MEPSIFTKIINGEIPSHKVFEDEHTFAFMDIYSEIEGKVLVIPKKEIDNFEDLPDELITAVMLTSKKVMLSLRKVFPEAKKIGLQVEGLEVPHAHVKLLPIKSSGDLHNTVSVEEPDHEKLAELADKIKENIDV